MNTTTTTASLYVGTYKKYNEGSIQGAWVSLEDFTDGESFLDYCKELHSDEEDPEFMFQDFEGFPDSFYSECMNSDDLDELFNFLNLDDDNKKIIQLYAEATGCEIDSDTLERALDRYQGQAWSGGEFAEQLAEICGEIPSNMPSWICIDWESSWACNLRHDYNTATDSSGMMHFFTY